MCMKVILLRDVAKIGRRYEIVEVPDGFALNKLIPKKDAEPATAANIKRIEVRNKNSQALHAGEVATIKQLEAITADLPLEISIEANEQGHLFKSVHAADIVGAGQARGLLIPENFLKLKEVIKTLGVHTVSLVVGNEKAVLTIVVVAKVK